MAEPPEDRRASPVQRTVRGMTSRSMRDLDRSSVLSMELLAGLLVWGAIGWGLDRWIGTWPVLFIIGALGGFAAGMWLVYRRVMGEVPAPPVRSTPRPVDPAPAGPAPAGPADADPAAADPASSAPTTPPQQ